MTHTMSIIREHEGIEEWHCSTCGRHLLIHWKPKFTRTILEQGDPNVSHAGFKQGAYTDANTAAPLSSLETFSHHLDDESRLTPWSDWLKKRGFDNLWKGEIQ